MKQIEVVVDREGIIKIHTKGFVGSSCRDASHFLVQTLGVCRHERITADFRQTDITKNIEIVEQK